MNEDLDCLEKEILATIYRCSVYDISTIKEVYRRLKSFDKTILALKIQVSTKQSFEEILRSMV